MSGLEFRFKIRSIRDYGGHVYQEKLHSDVCIYMNVIV